MKKTAIILADGFEEVEALTPVDLLRRAQLVCDMLALEDRETVIGSHGIAIRADKCLRDADLDSYDGIILPGGLRGTQKLAGDARVLELLRRFHAEGKLTAAICAAPTVLARAGLLEGRRAVSYPRMEDQLGGALVGTEAVALDGTVLTSRGLGTAISFALALVEYFCGAEKAGEIASRIVYR